MATIPSGTCCLCASTYTWYGNNAQPIVEGQCCDDCNYNYVIPARFGKRTDEELRNNLLRILAEYEDDEDSEDDEDPETYHNRMRLNRDEDPVSVLETPFV